MNKYLSYEKSKRLAELGYKPETLEYFYLGYKNWPVCAFANEESNDVRFFHRREFVKDWQIPDSKCHFFPAPDCHDLLMELQKHDRDNGPADFNSLKLYISHNMFHFNYLNVTRNIGTLPDIFEDPNPVEALGAALIKLQEELAK